MLQTMNPEDLGLLKKTLDTLPDGVLVVSANREVIYANDRFVSMWGVSDAAMKTSDDAHLIDAIADQVTDVESFRTKVEELYETHCETEDELNLTDGRVFLRRGAFHTDSEGQTAHIWVFSDITSLKAFEHCSLTGLYNRRKFDEDFSTTLANLDDKAAIGVAMLDLDNFKQFNDSYGHQQGDKLLSDIGRLLLKRLRRRGDVAYRIGGEEFVLLCQSRSEQHLFNFIDSIRQDVMAMACAHIGNAPHDVVTFSAGIAFVRGSSDAKVVFDKVDRALYAAKDKGRNIIVKVNV